VATFGDPIRVIRLPDPTLDPELRHRRSSECADLFVALEPVPPRQRAVLVLCYFED
jgi:DNA-directed RNA polymerase specialized sigma24 family protein